MGYHFDAKKFENDVEKFKKTLNLECNIHPIFELDSNEKLSLAE
jgi:hypothetical protein